jgi:hypothetical protein
MITSRYPTAYLRVRINAVDPGYTVTERKRSSGTQMVEEGARAIVAMACAGTGGPTGPFVAARRPVGW